MRVLQIVHSIDESGDKIVTVPLTNSERKVTMLEKDLDSLIAKGNPLTWKLVSNQVILTGKKKVLVARTMVDANKGDRVLFKDKNPCNMLRSNILYTDCRHLRNGEVIIEHINEQGTTETSSNHAGVGMS